MMGKERPTQGACNPAVSRGGGLSGTFIGEGSGSTRAALLLAAAEKRAAMHQLVVVLAPAAVRMPAAAPTPQRKEVVAAASKAGDTAAATWRKGGGWCSWWRSPTEVGCRPWGQRRQRLGVEEAGSCEERGNGRDLANYHVGSVLNRSIRWAKTRYSRGIQ